MSTGNPAVLKLNQSSEEGEPLVTNSIKPGYQLSETGKKSMENQCRSTGSETGKFNLINVAASEKQQLRFLVIGLLNQYKGQGSSDSGGLDKLIGNNSELIKNSLKNTGVYRFTDNDKNKGFDGALISKEKEVEIDTLSWNMSNPEINLKNCGDGFSLGDDSRGNGSKTENRNISSADGTTTTGKGTTEVISSCNDMKGNEYVFKKI